VLLKKKKGYLKSLNTNHMKAALETREKNLGHFAEDDEEKNFIDNQVRPTPELVNPPL